MKTYEIGDLFAKGKEYLAHSEWTNAAKTFFQIHTLVRDIDQTAAAVARYWQAASEIMAEDFGLPKPFKDFLDAYHYWMTVDPDDRNEAKLRGTECFCQAWLFILGDRDAPREDELRQLRDDTEAADTLIEVAAHLACEFALSRSSHTPCSVDTAKGQFLRFISCMRDRGDSEKLPRPLTESYRALADTLEGISATGTQNGIRAAFAPKQPKSDEDSVFTHLSLQQCARFYHSAVASLPATYTKREAIFGVASITVAWTGVIWLATAVAGTDKTVILLALLGPVPGFVLKRDWLMRHRRLVFTLGILILLIAGILTLVGVMHENLIECV